MVNVGAYIVTKEELLKKAYAKEIEMTIIEFLGKVVIEAKSANMALHDKIGRRPTLERILSEVFDAKIIDFEYLNDPFNQITFAKGDFIMYYVLNKGENA
jgi:hypothetical protein